MRDPLLQLHLCLIAWRMLQEEPYWGESSRLSREAWVTYCFWRTTDTGVKALECRASQSLYIGFELKNPMEKFPNWPVVWLVSYFGIKDGRFCINGVPVLVKGTNRHEHSQLGRTVSKELMEEDIKLMKQHNINTVRNSHYPTHPYWYQLARPLRTVYDWWGECRVSRYGIWCGIFGERFYLAACSHGPYTAYVWALKESSRHRYLVIGQMKPAMVVSILNVLMIGWNL